jgi:hypothetical protein
VQHLCSIFNDIGRALNYGSPLSDGLMFQFVKDQQ